MNQKLTTYSVIAALILGAVAIFLSLGGSSIVYNYGAVASPYDMGPEVGWGGVNRVASHGDFLNASTTFVGFKNPTGASSTLNLAVVKQTAVATTTANYACGLSYAPSGAPTIPLFTIGNTSTSTFWGNKGYFVQNASTTSSIIVDPNQYVVCYADTSGIGTAAGITNANNTFAGTYWFEFLVGR